MQREGPRRSSVPESRQGLERSLNFEGFSLRTLHHFFLRESEPQQRVHVNAAGLILDDGKAREAFPFSDMSGVSFTWIPFWSFKVHFKMQDGRDLTWPATVERLDYPLDLFAAARPELAEDESYARYRRIAIALDHAWTRLRQIFAQPSAGLLTEMSRILFTIVCAVGVTSFGQKMGWLSSFESVSAFALWLVDVLILAMIIGVVNHLVRESHLFYKTLKRLEIDPYDVKRDLAFEKSVTKKSLRWTYGVSALWAVLISILATFSVG